MNQKGDNGAIIANIMYNTHVLNYGIAQNGGNKYERTEFDIF